MTMNNKWSGFDLESDSMVFLLLEKAFNRNICRVILPLKAEKKIPNA